MDNAKDSLEEEGLMLELDGEGEFGGEELVEGDADPVDACPDDQRPLVLPSLLCSTSAHLDFGKDSSNDLPRGDDTVGVGVSEFDA